jgi:deaminated glutathione amidase
MKLKIATSQFPVSELIEENFEHIQKQIREAKIQGCDVVHFPECSLSGYAGIDFPSFENFNWELLRIKSMEILELAKREDIWIILGSTHRLNEPNKPHNSLYIIDNNGKIIDRYDKRFCAGDDTYKTNDLAYFSSGNHFTFFDIKGVKCSVQICHDYRYPELYRELKKNNVQVVFHSYHAGNMSTERKQIMQSPFKHELAEFNFGDTYPEQTMPTTMVSYAANNYMWISCSNTSAFESCWSCFAVRPDGIITGNLEKNKMGILITEIDTEVEFYDSTEFWRERALNGIYYSGEKINDQRSTKRTEL